jgi:NADH-quinone oxidoreductase subunit F
MLSKLKNRADLRSAREQCAAAFGKEKKQIFVCAGTGCVASGALDTYERLSALMKEHKLDCSVELALEPEARVNIGIKKSGCHGFCEMGPLVLIEPEGYLYTKVKPTDCEDIVARTIMNGEVCKNLIYHLDGEA